ncbi:MAG: hypothetical protein R3202_00075, partial [Candidatus Competibacterales bacterium]|nr:hypothetical protein [Candidatus Competibacterales bacterium]
VKYVVVTKSSELSGKFAVGMAEGKSALDAGISATTDVAIGSATDLVSDTILPTDATEELLKDGIAGVPLPAETTLTIAGRSLVKARSSDTSSEIANKITEAIKKQQHASPGKPLKLRLALGEPAMADLAIIGPDKSLPTRRWSSN